MAKKRNVFEDTGSDIKVHAAEKGTIEQGAASGRSAVAVWLWMLIILIVAMINVGGLTRLTDSGLSITEWDPVMGAIPPLTTSAWTAAFDAYKTTAEFTFQNMAMNISEFKIIFWWEWGHRQLGRFIGLIWFGGFTFLLVSGKLPKNLRLSVLLIGPFIGVQGLIGWLMVNSGLDGIRVDVASYWLMMHLGAAFALLGYIYWIAQISGRREVDLLQSRRIREHKLFGMSTGLMHFVALQVLL